MMLFPHQKPQIKNKGIKNNSLSMFNWGIFPCDHIMPTIKFKYMVYLLCDCCRPRLTCFNCLGAHNMKDCRQTKDWGRINKNKQDLFGSPATPKNSKSV